MDEDVKNKWVAALRSGEYKQCRGVLKTEKGHCCLGVLCEVLDHRAILHDGRYIYGGEKYILPNSIREEAGMKTSHGSWAGNYKCLAELNDEGEPFGEIADIIEANWRNL
jgi:hypothetical protein